MAVEFTFYNPGNELTFSGDGITYSYVGRATPTGLFQPSGSALIGNAGSSSYTIEWAGDILVALPVKANGVTALLSVTQSGSTWTISVYKSNGTNDSKNLDAQEYTEVYVFGAPAIGASSTFMLYDANGNPCADLSRRPLTYKARISMATNALEWTPTVSTSVPAIIGFPQDLKVTNVPTPAPSYTNWIWKRGWQLGTNGKIQRNQYAQRWTIDDGGFAFQDTVNPLDAILIDVAGLT